MVRASEAAGDENILQLAADSRHPVLMGRCILRILRPGPRKQDRIHRQWRAVQPDAAESDPGSHIIDGIYRHRHSAVQEPGPGMEPLRGILLPHPGSILRIPQIDARQISEKLRNHMHKNLEVQDF